MVEGNTGAEKVAFNILHDYELPPSGSQYMNYHMVFSFKVDHFFRKACQVAGDHMVDAPKRLTYASMVSRDSVRIVLSFAAMNDPGIKTSDIQSVYLTAPCVHTKIGTEFGEDKGKTVIIVRALYGLA